MHTNTEILHTKIDITRAHPNVTPLFQASSFLSSSEYFYTRKSNPNSAELEEVLKKLEGCEYVASVTTGMAAISMAMRLLQPGDHLLVNELIYGCSYQYFEEFSHHYQIHLDFVDMTDLAGLTAKLRPSTKMIFFETPTNPLLKTISIKQVAELRDSHCPSALIVVDNTWATSLFQKPLKCGADLSVVSGTKFYGGHSDCMAGFISTNQKELAEKIFSFRFFQGCILDPHSAWLMRRSMQTFTLRMREHESKLKVLSGFLRELPEVNQVYLPEIDDSQMTGYGCILFFELKDQYKDQVSQFMDSLQLFDRGTSMACVVSAVAQPFSGSHLSMSAEAKIRVGIKETLIRLCFGLEEAEDLKEDLLQAFGKLHA